MAKRLSGKLCPITAGASWTLSRRRSGAEVFERVFEVRGLRERSELGFRRPLCPFTKPSNYVTGKPPLVVWRHVSGAQTPPSLMAKFAPAPCKTNGPLVVGRCMSAREAVRHVREP